jgi:hypothetical protein
VAEEMKMKKILKDHIKPPPKIRSSKSKKPTKEFELSPNAMKKFENIRVKLKKIKKSNAGLENDEYKHENLELDEKRVRRVIDILTLKNNGNIQPALVLNGENSDILRFFMNHRRDLLPILNRKRDDYLRYLTGFSQNIRQTLLKSYSSYSSNISQVKLKNGKTKSSLLFREKDNFSKFTQSTQKTPISNESSYKQTHITLQKLLLHC